MHAYNEYLTSNLKELSYGSLSLVDGYLRDRSFAVGVFSGSLTNRIIYWNIAE